MTRQKAVYVRLSEMEKQRLSELAQEMGCPQSDVVRWALRRELTKKTVAKSKTGA